MESPAASAFPLSVSQTVSSFNVDGISRIDAVLRLAKQQQLPVGIEYAGSKLFEPVTVHVGSTDLSAVIEALFPAGSEFRISTADGVLVISHSEVPESRVNVLDRVPPDLSIPESSVLSASAELQIWLSRWLRPVTHGYGFSISGGGDVLVGPFEFKQATVREALNRIVRAHGRAAWIVQVKPEMVVDPGDYMQSGGLLWTVVEYESPLIERIGQITQDRVQASDRLR